MLTIEQQLLLAKKSYDGIIAQRCAALNGGAIEHLIDSNILHKENFEGKSARNIDVMKAVEKSQGLSLDKGAFSTDGLFLVALQAVHDNAADAAGENLTDEEFIVAFKAEFSTVEKQIQQGIWT